MLGYLEYINQIFNIPIGLIVAIVVFFAVSNLIGEILEFKGKVVPEIFKIRKYFARKKQERETLAKLPETFDKVEVLLDDVNQHYSEDNILKRNQWIDGVNQELKRDDEKISRIQNKVDNIETVLYNMDVQNKRKEILTFAEKVVDETYPVTYESFDYISNIWAEYKKIIEERGISNGVVEKSIEIIEEEFEKRLRDGNLIESMRGMDSAFKTISFR